MIPRGLIIGILVGVFAGGILGLILIIGENPNQLEFVDSPSISILTDKIDYQKGENIRITIVNSGNVSLTFSDASYGLEIRALDGTILFSPISAQVISILDEKEEIQFVWDQIKNDGDQALEGTYKITSDAKDPQGNIVKKSITINILK